MAVYTNITHDELNSFLNLYELENLLQFSGIKEGIENSNYLLETQNFKYILTIFEKRTNENDLPYFFILMNHLSESKTKCCLLYTSPSPRDLSTSRMPSSA